MAGTTTAEIASRLHDVERRIEASATRAGRTPAAVSLVVVTKGHNPEVLRAAYAAGLRRFGENRVEELVPKVAALADLEGVEWHLIGHVQSRKVRDLPVDIALIHSVDRLKIALRLDEHAAKLGRQQDVLLECNMSGEPQKDGWMLPDPGAWATALPEFDQVSRLPGLRVLGLMTIAPMTPDVAVLRRTFRSLRELRSFAADRLRVDWPHLSMGMSDDFEVAVEEGATMLRIGRAILGERPAGTGEGG
ncbi:MAG TPA: YggS family pyridoxal phosphate-dependent enzyme [Anaerolineales bacterium]|nr:YggS family pyridoxal phosphate-dependent enzyme [Anaerolineales bacterium]